MLMSMRIQEWKDKKVTVMGLGLHGGALGTIQWLAERGAAITVTDLKTAKELEASVQKLVHLPGIRFVLGEHRVEDFTHADMVIRNPSVPRTSEFLQHARAAGVPVEMDSSLFFAHVPSNDIIGVTGSKGKTTTANAIAVLLKYLNPATVAVGMDGVSPLGELAAISPGGIVVFELSSWRLEALDEKTISPHTAVVTSLLRDHLNTYASFDEYVATKRVIVKYQLFPDIAILNYDDERLRTWGGKARRFWYSLNGDIPGDGIFVRGGDIVIRHTTQEIPLFSLRDLPLHYPHEQRNLLPALLLGHLRGLAPDELKAGILRVHGLPHRLEHVVTKDGVTYVNDSAATMPDATIAALRSLADKTIVHILGGSDKALEFAELAEVESRANIRALVWLPGTATKRMQEQLQAKIGPRVHVAEAASMEEAVRVAKEVAEGGDVVLLSPGATSFGLFKHEFDRGNRFRAAVKKLEIRS